MIEIKDPNQIPGNFGTGLVSAAGQQALRLMKTQHSEKSVAREEEETDLHMSYRSGVSIVPPLEPLTKKRIKMPSKETKIRTARKNEDSPLINTSTNRRTSIESEMESVVSNLTLDSHTTETDMSERSSTRQIRRRSVPNTKQIPFEKTTTRATRENEDNTQIHATTRARTSMGSEMESTVSNLTSDSHTTESKSLGRSSTRKRRTSGAARNSRDVRERGSIVNRVKNFISGSNGGVSSTRSVGSRSNSLRRKSARNERRMGSTASTGRARPRRHSETSKSNKNRMEFGDSGMSDVGRRRASITSSVGSRSKTSSRHSVDASSTVSTDIARTRRTYSASESSVNTRNSTSSTGGSWRPRRASHESSAQTNKSTSSTGSSKRRKSTGGMERRRRPAGDNEESSGKRRHNIDDDTEF